MSFILFPGYAKENPLLLITQKVKYRRALGNNRMLTQLEKNDGSQINANGHSFSNLV